MTKKDYALIAGAIKEALHTGRMHSKFTAGDAFDAVISEIVLACKRENSAFDESQFRNACYH